MQQNIGGSVAQLPSLRSCARCGAGFRSVRKHYLCPSCRHTGRPKPRAANELSRREIQIVDLVEQAKPNKEIAFVLHLSEGTVKEYLHRIFRKLNVTNRTELALRSYHGVLSVNNISRPPCDRATMEREVGLASITL